MKSIAIWIQKGGTGKTTTAGNLAYALRARGRVLVIDADPQGNASAWLHAEQFEAELADVLAGKVSLEKAILPIREGLDILPTFAIGGGLKAWAETVLPSRPFAFQDLLDRAAGLGYAYAIIDLSPGASILERSIVAAVDEALPVVRPEVFSVDGLETFDATIDTIRRDLRARVTVPRLVINGVNLSFPVHKAYAEKLGALSYSVFTIAQTAKTTNAQTERRFLAEYDAGNRTIPEYARLAEAVA